MPVDILVFAAIAAFLIFRLNALLGTRDRDERARPNPFADKAVPPLKPAPQGGLRIVSQALPIPRFMPPMPTEMIDTVSNKDGRVEAGLSEISMADGTFAVGTFLQGAQHAFGMIVEAFAKGDLEAIKPLVSPKLYAEFASGVSTRLAAGRTSEVTIHRIIASHITEAHLGGVMAYVTVAFDVEETAVTRDATGAVVEGDPDRIFTISDIWTFTRDIRSPDPNWTLIETKSAEK